MAEPLDLKKLFAAPAPVLVLAPMQDVTDLAFWRLLATYGGPDIYFTEYFRVHRTSTPERHILKAIAGNPDGKPVVAQMIGNDIPSLVRTALQLQRYPIAGIDLNLGCPAPVVYRKCAGGGLLRDLKAVDAILGALREAVAVPLSVKTRIGFNSPDVFPQLLSILAKHSLDFVTVHGRTVKEMYRSEVHWDCIARAAAELPCPVLANGNVYSAARAGEVVKLTGARGVMIGRGVIRNPWLFRQIRERQAGQPLFIPRGRDVLDYVAALYDASCADSARESSQVQRMKKYMNYLGLGVESTGDFLHQIRRVTTKAGFFAVCEQFLDHNQPMPLEPFPLELHEADVLAGEHR